MCSSYEAVDVEFWGKGEHGRKKRRRRPRECASMEFEPEAVRTLAAVRATAAAREKRRCSRIRSAGPRRKRTRDGKPRLRRRTAMHMHERGRQGRLQGGELRNVAGEKPGSREQAAEKPKEHASMGSG